MMNDSPPNSGPLPSWFERPRSANKQQRSYTVRHGE